jgi:hypothetical protein
MESLVNVISNIQKTNSETSLQNSQQGIPYWSLIESPPITPANIVQLKIALEENYKTAYTNSFMELLANLMVKDKWNVQRLQDTLEWFIKTNPYPNFGAANWFNYNVKLYPYSWYLEQLNKGVRNEDIDRYKINGELMFRMKDGTTLPFEKAEYKTPPTTRFVELTKEEADGVLMSLREGLEMLEREEVEKAKKEKKSASESKDYEW